MKGEIIFKNGTGQLDNTVEKDKVKCIPYTIYRNIFQMDQRLTEK